VVKRQTKVLSDAQLRAWFTAGEPVAKADGDGLTFTLSSSGTAVWVLRYRTGGRRRELTLGRYPDLSLQAARKKAAVERLRVADGVDVAAEKRRGKHASVAAWTVRQLTEDYEIKVLAHRAASTRKLWGLYLKNWLKPKLGSLLARDVQRADVVAMLRAAASRGAGSLRTLHSCTRLVFAHAVGQAIRETNPVDGIKVSSIKAAPDRRKGIALTSEELGPFLRALPHSVEGFAFRLHLLTGVRPAELIAAPWSEFDLTAGTWAIAGERTKTREGYEIELPAQAVELLQRLREAVAGSAFLFPAGYGDVDRPMPYQTYRGWLRRQLDRLISCPRWQRSTTATTTPTSGAPRSRSGRHSWTDSKPARTSCQSSGARANEGIVHGLRPCDAPRSAWPRR
jgi:integrase